MGCGSSKIFDSESANKRLVKAAAEGDCQGICDALTDDADVNWQDPEYGRATALHRAIQERQEQAAEYLLECKASVEITDENQWTPLHYAAQTQEDLSGLMSKLLQAGGEDAQNQEAGAPSQQRSRDSWQEIKTI